MSNAVTIKNVKDYLVANPGMLFYGWTGVTGVDWVDQYIAQHDYIDDILFRKYYSMFILDYGELCGSESNAIDAINAAACNELYNNKYKWDGLWESTILTFNPLWNVDADITETRTPDLKHTSGARTDYTDNKSYTDTNNNYSYPFDAAGTAKQTDKSELVRGAHKDGFEKGQQIDSETGTDTTHIIRQGNIGVTTSTQLLTEYRSFVAYSFWEQFMEAICEAVLIYQDDMEYLEVTGGGGSSTPVTATATANTLPGGTPASVSVTSYNNNLTFLFGIPEGPEGPPGQDGNDGAAAEITGATASVSAGVTPSCVVTLGGTPQERTFDFAFSGITGGSGNAKKYAISTYGNTSADAKLRVLTYENGEVTSTDILDANNLVNTWQTYDCFRVGYAFTPSSWTVEILNDCAEYTNGDTIVWNYQNFLTETLTVSA